MSREEAMAEYDRQWFAKHPRKPSGNGAGASAAADGCMAIYLAYRGVKVEDDLRLLMGMCDTPAKVAQIREALAGWESSGRWTENQFIPHLRNWLLKDQCWAAPPPVVKVDRERERCARL